MAYSFDDPAAPDRHETPYSEIMGNRSIHHKGLTAVTAHGTPLQVGPGRSFGADVWDLYDTMTDWSQAHDRAVERANPDLAGRPALVRGQRQQLYGDLGRLHAISVISIKVQSHVVTAEVTVPATGAVGSAWPRAAGLASGRSKSLTSWRPRWLTIPCRYVCRHAYRLLPARRRSPCPRSFPAAP